MNLLYFCPFGSGGLAAYAHEQANALCEAGSPVTLVSTADFPEHEAAKYRLVCLFPSWHGVNANIPGWFRRFRTAWAVLRNHFRLRGFISKGGFGHVLMGSYSEYLAPLWAWGFRRLARDGVVFGAVVHDPVRNFVVGPGWWHRWSVAAGYSFLREAFVHAPIELQTGRDFPDLRTTVIPQGIYRVPVSSAPREDVRRRLALPVNATVLLAFGNLRDEKNLDLAIESLVGFSDVYLVVAGREQNARSTPGHAYKALADRHGVGERCRWLLRYVPPEEVGDLFAAADIVCLPYSRQFHSASSVLNIAVSFRKPSLVSSGEGNLKEMVTTYGLGVWVEPDRVESLRRGLEALLTAPPAARWDDFERQESWERNAALVLAAMSDRGPTWSPPWPKSTMAKSQSGS